MIIAIEGPEKSGKSTLVNAIAEKSKAKIRHWGPISPDDRVYSKYLIQEALSDEWFIWDRCWPSEHVYGKLLKRDRRLVDDPWLGEWLHGRILQTNGLRIMVLPSSVEELINRRDSTDLPVAPNEEVREYAKYAKEFGWEIYVNPYTENWIHRVTNVLCTKMAKIGGPIGNASATFAGDRNSKVVFVGANIKTPTIPGAGLPFTDTKSIEFARALGPVVFQCAWTNGRLSKDYCIDKKIVACGVYAQDWSRNIRSKKVLHIPHPTIFYDESNKSSYMEEIITKTKYFCKGEL